MDARTPVEMLNFASDLGVVKVQRKIPSLLILAFFAGVYIGFAAVGSTMAAHNLLANPETHGLGRLLTGLVFAAGLMMVVLTGAEMLTGNTLIVVSVYDRKVSVKQMLINWLLAYTGNLLGGIFLAVLVSKSGVFALNGGLLGGTTVQIAANKTSLPFHSAFILGILCNWIVCTAVFVSFGSRDLVGKIFAIFFINSLFVMTGYEHSIANMYYIPAGILAAQSQQFVAMSQVSAENLANLTWANFAVKNLIPVTLGNIIGGALMVWTLFWLALKKKDI